MASFARQHEYRLGRALILAFVLVLIGSWLFPVQWLRYFGRPVHRPDPALPAGDRWVRLIPVESLARGPDAVLIQEPATEPDSPELDYGTDSPRHSWSFDPTTAWRAAPGSVEPMAPSLPDSVVLRAHFLNSLRLANWGEVLALLDTTQEGRAHEQMAETDLWINRHFGPVWAAQGYARRQSNLWNRVVREVEAEGSQ